jgi:metacaspase-1
MNPTKAVCIGINYYNTNNRLYGCINDAKSFQQLLINKYGYKAENIQLLTDDPDTPFHDRPRRMRVLEAFEWLLRDIQAGDKVVFTYSGHGYHVPDRNGDEADGRDEVICTIDGVILDDEINAYLCRKIPKGAQLTCIFDCCHSGTLCDLKYNYKCNDNNRDTYSLHIEHKRTPAEGNVIMFSGCYDHQVSMDIHCNETGKPCGAFTSSFMKSLARANFSILIGDLLHSVNRQLLSGRFNQVTQLSASRPDVIDERFSF